MSDLEKYLEFVNKEIDVELLCLYALDKLKNPLGRKMVESDLEKFEKMRSQIDRKRVDI